MTTILEKEFLLTEDDHQTNIKIPFVLTRNAEKLMIEFSYTPAFAKGEQAKKKIEQALLKFVPENEWKKWGNSSRYLPLYNLVTFSLSYEGNYLGARHRKSTNQTIIISENESTKGFIKQKATKGNWEAQLNIHCVATDSIQASMRIKTEGVR